MDRCRIAIRGVILLAALAATVMGGQAGHEGPGQAGCEPGVDLDLTARTAEIRQQGSTARVLVEITIASRLDLTDAVLSGRRLDPKRTGTAGGLLALSALGQARSGGQGQSGPGGLSLPVAAGDVRKLVVAVELVQGTRHDLLFTLSGEGQDGAPVQVEAHLPVNLDPALAPEILDGLIQYRAVNAP